MLSLASFAWTFFSSKSLVISSKAAVNTSRASLTCFPITGRISAETSFIPLRISVRDPFFPRTETRSSCNSFSFSAEICFNAASVSSRSAFNCSSIVDIFPPSWSIYRHRKNHAPTPTFGALTRGTIRFLSVNQTLISKSFTQVNSLSFHAKSFQSRLFSLSHFP